MTDNITLIGFVATVPRHTVTGEGLPITSFRLASTHRRFDRAQGRWADGETNWYTISMFRQLAINAVSSVGKGDRVIVSGRLRIRSWEVADRSGTTIEVDADALGHDLSWGTTTFVRTVVNADQRQGTAVESPRDGGAGEPSQGHDQSSEAAAGSDSGWAVSSESQAPSSSLEPDAASVPF